MIVHNLILLSIIIIIFSNHSCISYSQDAKRVSQVKKNSLPIILSKWEDPGELLTVDKDAFTNVMSYLGLNKRRISVLLISLDCGDCLAALRTFEQYECKRNQCVAIAYETSSDSKREEMINTPYTVSYKHNYPIYILSQKDFANTGAMIVPTLVVIKDGVWQKAMDVSQGFPINE